MSDTNKKTELMSTTAGEWIVSTTPKGLICVQAIESQKIVAVTGAIGSPVISVPEATANAALISVSKNMLDVLIAIQEAVINPACEDVDLIAINGMISEVFAKLANEAGQ